MSREMSLNAVHIEGLGKRYARVRAGQRPDSLREALSQAAAAMLKRARTGNPERMETFWALKDVSLSIQQGEILGVIGSNGAGKSTLLKILSRITKPSEGWAEVRGRVGSLLEVGTGFNWELTGRENVFLNGAILGMRASEVRRKFDEIVAFAEVEPFIDTPVKRYSSGMYMRLAFAVAAHLEPDVLIVDEVLAVGDAAFQRKCLSKMGAESMQGRTVLFVSHNMVAIEALSHRVVWLGSGQVIADGLPKQVVSAYLGTGRGETTERSWPIPDAPGVYLARAALRSAGSETSALRITDPVHLEFDVRSTVANANPGLAMHLYNEQDVLVLATTPSPVIARQELRPPPGLTRFRCTIPANLLNDGLYRVEAVVRADAEAQSIVAECLLFRVHDAPELREGWYGDWQGVVRPSIDWSIEAVD